MEILRIGNYRFSAPEKNHVKSAKRQLLEIEPRTNCCNVNFSDGAFISWREVHSSTGRLVTGGGGTAVVQKTKLSITRSIFELEARNVAWKFVWIV